MIVEPYKLRPVAPRLALLQADGLLLGEDGRALPLRSLDKGVQCWAALDRVQQLLRAGEGRALCWRGQPIRYTRGLDDFRVRVLSLPFPADDADALAGLCGWRDWLASEGASPLGSLGSSSMSLLRSTLDAPLWTGVPFASCPPFRFTVGGRQELGPAGAPAWFAGRLRHFDMRAAYASRLGSLEYGGHWFRIPSAKVAEHAPWFRSFGKIVVCRARVRLSGSWPGPLVRRPRKAPEAQLGSFHAYPREGALQGVWTLDELDVARELGCSVRLLEGWVHNAPSRPFERWWHAVEAGREAAGFAGLLAKATGNALWGQFCISEQGRRQLLFYDRAGRRVIRELPVRGGRRPAHDLAECLTGQVRAELTRFLAAAGPRLCSAHTDGGWVECEASRSTGERFTYPAWRSKDAADELRVLDPQLLAYRRPGESAWCYVVSGWPADGAEELFEREWEAALARQAA